MGQCAVLAALVSFLPPLWAAAGQAAGADPQDAFEDWIERLGSDDIAAREDAALRLRRAGRPAWPALRRATRAPDLEVAARARDLRESVALRRRLSFRMLESFPTAEAALRNGPPAARAALARAMGAHLEESREFLRELLNDSDPETALTAAEALYEARTSEWIPRMLDLLASECPPRPRRIAEMLSTSRAHLTGKELRERYVDASIDGRSRILELSAAAQVPFAVDAHEVLELLPDPRARAGAVEWIVSYNRREFAVPLEEQLTPTAPDALELLQGLRRLNHSVLAERLTPFLKHAEETVREQAVQMLPDDADPATEAVVATLLQDASTSVRQRAIAALVRRRGEEARETLLGFFLRQDGDPRDTAAFLLCRQRDWTAERARALVRDSDPERRLRGADLLARLEGIQAVRELAGDPSELVRRWLLSKALATSDEASINVVRRLATDSSPAIRFDAIRALARGGKAEDVEALVPWLSSAEFTFRYHAAETYLRQGGEKARDLVAQLLDDGDASLQCLAITALQERASPEAASRAVGMLCDPDVSLRRAAGAYLEQALGSTRDPALVAAVTNLLDRLEGETLSQAAGIVIAHGSAVQASAVRKLLASGRAPHEGRALDALARWDGPLALLDCLSEERVGLVLERVADALRAQPPDDATRRAIEDRIAGLASAESPRVRRTLLRYLPDLPCRAGMRIASELLDDPDASVRHAAVRAARRLSAPIVPRLRLMLDDEDPELRLAAALALFEIDPAAAPDIEEMLAREECDWIRRRVTAAVGR
ncbi:MAG: HEAT repeat domain-containing protein [Planctomycetes bacterium]|nr:HEAT repeat domain-containing protein [Planctomycetota bacterium]